MPRSELQPRPPGGPPTRSPAQAAPSPDIVVAEVYGGGGNTGATLQNDYIELFNRSGRRRSSLATASRSSTPARPARATSWQVAGRPVRGHRSRPAGTTSSGARRRRGTERRCPAPDVDGHRTATSARTAAARSRWRTRRRPGLQRERRPVHGRGAGADPRPGRLRRRRNASPRGARRADAGSNDRRRCGATARAATDTRLQRGRLRGGGARAGQPRPTDAVRPTPIASRDRRTPRRRAGRQAPITVPSPSPSTRPRRRSRSPARTRR